MRFSTLKLGYKIVGLVIVSILVLSACSAWVVTRLKYVIATYSELVEDEATVVAKVASLDSSGQEMGRLLFFLLISLSEEEAMKERARPHRGAFPPHPPKADS